MDVVDTLKRWFTSPLDVLLERDRIVRVVCRHVGAQIPADVGLVVADAERRQSSRWTLTPNYPLVTTRLRRTDKGRTGCAGLDRRCWRIDARVASVVVRPAVLACPTNDR